MSDYMCSVILTKHIPTSQWTLLAIRPILIRRPLHWAVEGVEYRALNSRFHPVSCDVGKDWAEGKENSIQYGPGCTCGKH